MLIQVANIVRNHHHVKRSQDKQLAEELNNRGIAIISGANKTGKTELAAEYYIDKEKGYDYSFWLRASTVEELFQDFKKIIEEYDNVPAKMKLLINEIKDLKTLLAKLKRVFESLTEKWLIVIDGLGIREVDTLLPATSQDKMHHVIITVSDENAELLSANAPSVIKMEAFTQQEYESLFAQRLPNKILISEDKNNIDTLIKQLGKDLDVLTIVSRIYSKKEKQENLLTINEDGKLNPAQIRQKLAIIAISDEGKLLKQIAIASLFKSCSVPAQWFPMLQEKIDALKKYEVLTEGSDEKQKIALMPPVQTLFTAELVADETSFKDYDASYANALKPVVEKFLWTRTNYNKKLKNNDSKQQSHMAELATALLSQFPTLQKKAREKLSVERIFEVVSLTNSLGRYNFIQEWFEDALASYQAAKEKFDLLLTDDEEEHFTSDNRDKNKDKELFQKLLAEKGAKVCWVYAQEILHNIGATIVKISWNATEKNAKLDQAIKFLQLAFNWQVYLIENCNFDADLITFVKQQLGLDNSKEWKEKEIKAELYHFAYFTKRVIAQTYIQKKDLAAAQKTYQELEQDARYKDRLETKPLAYRDLANVLRRQTQPQLDLALKNIETALPFFEDKKFPAEHYRGEKEQVLYERAKIYLAIAKLEQKKIDELQNLKAEVKKGLLAAAEKDLIDIIDLKSDSALYKAKAYYQLAQIAKARKNKIDEQKYLEQAINAIAKGNPTIKQKASEDYHKNLALELTEDHNRILSNFETKFVRAFLTSLKTTLSDLKNDSVGTKLKLAMGILESIFGIVPNIPLTLPGGAETTVQNPLPGLVKGITDNIIEYRKKTREVTAAEIEAVKKDVQQSAKALAELITKQYSYQISCLKEGDKDDIEKVINAAVKVLIDFIQTGRLLTAEDGYNGSVADQLQKVLMDKIPKITLATSAPAVNKKWNAQGFFNKSAFLVKEPDNKTVFYARNQPLLDRHDKYGYNVLDKKPIPTEYFKSYDSEKDLEEEKQRARQAQPGCSIM